MRYLPTYVVAALLWSASAQADLHQVDHSKSDLNDLAAMLEGHFENSQQLIDEEAHEVPDDLRHNRVDFIYTRIDLPEFGDVVFHSRQYSEGDPANLFRVALYSIEKSKHADTYRMKIYLFKDLDKYKDVDQDLSLLTDLDPSVYSSLPSECDLLWRGASIILW